MPFTDPPMPSQFDVGDPNAGHFHFDQHGMKVYANDGVTLIAELDSDVFPAAALFSLLGIIAAEALMVQDKFDGSAKQQFRAQPDIAGNQFLLELLDEAALAPILNIVGTGGGVKISDIFAGFVTIRNGVIQDDAGNRFMRTLDGGSGKTNSGSTQITTDVNGQATIAHGLGATPNVVIPSYHSAATPPTKREVHAATFTAANFTVTVYDTTTGAAIASTTLTIDWIATV